MFEHKYYESFDDESTEAEKEVATKIYRKIKLFRTSPEAICPLEVKAVDYLSKKLKNFSRDKDNYKGIDRIRHIISHNKYNLPGEIVRPEHVLKCLRIKHKEEIIGMCPFFSERAKEFKSQEPQEPKVAVFSKMVLESRDELHNLIECPTAREALEKIDYVAHPNFEIPCKDEVTLKAYKLVKLLISKHRFPNILMDCKTNKDKKHVIFKLLREIRGNLLERPMKAADNVCFEPFESKVRQCQACGRHNQFKAKFCAACGKELI